MPLKVITMADQRRQIVEKIRAGIWNVTEASRETGLSRKTIYQYLKRAEDPTETFEDRSRRPHTTTRTDPSIEAIIMEVAHDYPVWGETKIRKECVRRYPELTIPAARTVGRIMDRHDHHPGGQTPSPTGWQRFVSAAPNLLWQMDFKGWFRTTDRITIHPLSVLDDHSRFLLGLDACTNQARETVWTSLRRLFQLYGLPERILADNAGPWGAPGTRALTGLDLWLIQLGIVLIHGRPYHPQTQGKVERFHGTLKRELITRTTFTGVLETQARLDHFRDTYNTRCAHQAIENRYPVEVYQPSRRPYPDLILPPDYPDALAIRKVGYNGTISYENRRILANQQLQGEYVGIYEHEEEDTIDIMYYRTILRTVDLRTVPKRP